VLKLKLEKVLALRANAEAFVVANPNDDDDDDDDDDSTLQESLVALFLLLIMMGFIATATTIWCWWFLTSERNASIRKVLLRDLNSLLPV